MAEPLGQNRAGADERFFMRGVEFCCSNRAVRSAIFPALGIDLDILFHQSGVQAGGGVAGSVAGASAAAADADVIASNRATAIAPARRGGEAAEKENDRSAFIMQSVPTSDDSQRPNAA